MVCLVLEALLEEHLGFGMCRWICEPSKKGAIHVRRLFSGEDGFMSAFSFCGSSNLSGHPPRGLWNGAVT